MLKSETSNMCLVKDLKSKGSIIGYPFEMISQDGYAKAGPNYRTRYVKSMYMNGK